MNAIALSWIVADMVVLTISDSLLSCPGGEIDGIRVAGIPARRRSLFKNRKAHAMIDCIQSNLLVDKGAQ